MRFPLAWAETAKQNSVLKYSLLISSTLTVIFAITATVLSMRAPLVIERSCFSSVAQAASSSHTDQEVESFLRIALEKRFSTEESLSTLFWLSSSEEQAKFAEQKELKTKNIHQRILISHVNLQGNLAMVEMDRVLSVEKLRTVIPVSVLVQISSVSRNEVNPYGILMEKVELKKEAKSDVQNK